MDIGPLVKALRHRITISDSDIEQIQLRFRSKTFKRRELFLQPNHIARDVVFVLHGCMKSYSVDQEGVEHVVQFAPQGWWITDMYSFIAEKPAFLYVEALEKTEALLLSRQDQLQLFNEIPVMERYFRMLTENALVSARQRVHDNLSLTARERYAGFCKTYPELIHSVPLKSIASYIGVTPEFLSKIRAEYKQKG